MAQRRRFAAAGALACRGAMLMPMEPYPYRDFPTLRAEHVRDARLYADRNDMLLALQPVSGGIFGEIGVGLGGFSRFLLDAFEPSRFVAFDTFELHRIPVLWGKTAAQTFGGRTHRRFYEDRFASRGAQVVIEQGSSHVTLARYPEEHFDLLYVDADHAYEGVKRDAELAKRRIRPDGLLVFNDYIMFDHLAGGAYGVVPVVNELVVAEGWQVVGLSLQQQMFCDIALRRPAAS